jgi:hypothetical protein
MERLCGAKAERGRLFDETFFNERGHPSCTGHRVFDWRRPWAAQADARVDPAGKGELLADGFEV